MPSRIPTDDDDRGDGGSVAASIPDLLRALISVTARTAFADRDLIEIVAPSTRGRGGLISAYNACDGTRTQAEVVAYSKLHQGQFSTTVSRWVEAGVMFRLQAGRRIHLLHARPISKRSMRESE